MRNDQWGAEVCGRLQNCNDLVADEAIYHRQCHTKFFHKMGASTKSVGRPGDTSIKDIFKCLCDWFETESEIELVTLKELHEKMLSLSDGKDVYSIKWLLNKLKELYGDQLIFAEVNGKHNVLCFKNMKNYIINNKWYQERSLNIDDEAERVIKTAAKLIPEEIRQMTLENEVYPSPEDIKNIAINNSMFIKSMFMSKKWYLLSSRLWKLSW